MTDDEIQSLIEVEEAKKEAAATKKGDGHNLTNDELPF
ncbi:hypothetical protein SAMN05444416_109177 [Thermoactinomyces sp. DSM 45892]|nr:hypothetical protein SAMN05444416_109177 [Thermoactinomyces sp. DSM 45892]